MKPLVSICIPTFNREKLVTNAINCAISQTYDNIEILVSDDHSTDNSVNIIKKIKDKRLRLIAQKKNLGMVQNWNYCINAAKGEYIKFIASDDLIDPECVERELDFFNKHKDVSLVTCKRKFIDENNRILFTLQYSNKTKKESGKKYVHQMLTSIRENRIGEPSAVMFKKQDAIEAGLFDPQFSQYSDFEFWLRLLAFGNIGYINKPLCSFMVHRESNTSAAINDGRFIDETFKLINKYYENREYSKTFCLSRSDKKKVIQLKTLDYLKNIKDLFIKGKIGASKIYLNKLKQYVSIPSLLLSSIEHLLKK